MHKERKRGDELFYIKEDLRDIVTRLIYETFLDPYLNKPIVKIDFLKQSGKSENGRGIDFQGLMGNLVGHYNDSVVM